MFEDVPEMQAVPEIFKCQSANPTYVLNGMTVRSPIIDFLSISISLSRAKQLLCLGAYRTSFSCEVNVHVLILAVHIGTHIFASLKTA